MEEQKRVEFIKVEDFVFSVCRDVWEEKGFGVVASNCLINYAQNEESYHNIEDYIDAITTDIKIVLYCLSKFIKIKEFRDVKNNLIEFNKLLDKQKENVEKLLHLI